MAASSPPARSDRVSPGRSPAGGAGRRRAKIAAALVVLLTAPVPLSAQTVIPAPGGGAGGSGEAQAMPDTYLWHVTGLPAGAMLDLRSGAGVNFRVIASLREGTAADMQTCQEIRGGYWCRIATVDRPRISGWVDGRFVVKTGGEPPGTIGGVIVEPQLDLPIRPPRPSRPERPVWPYPANPGTGPGGGGPDD